MALLDHNSLEYMTRAGGDLLHLFGYLIHIQMLLGALDDDHCPGGVIRHVRRIEEVVRL